MASHAEAPGRILVGREAELAAIREVLNRAANGKSGHSWSSEKPVSARLRSSSTR